jgi:eukaryotic-like serine/threonine-protein kinase
MRQISCNRGHECAFKVYMGSGMASVQNEAGIPSGTILVGKYKVTREIGRGGMAAVYEAEHLALAKRVAIKVLAAELTASKIVSERFFREARAAASVKSPHIVDVYDSGRLEDGRPFIAMELLEGESLYDRMASVRLIDPKTTAKIILDCSKGLAKAHSAGIVHRDLKPENIFILRGEDGKEYCKLLDFGLAKFYAPVQSGDEKAARLTREGAVFGTPAYMSPEQVKGQGNVDHRADLWALGCMAYECLTGRSVWNTEQGVAMTFAAIATEPIPVPSEVYPDVPVGFDAWFRKALERDVSKRFQSAMELAEALIVAMATPSGSLPQLRVSSRDVNAAGGLSSRDVNAPSPSSPTRPSTDSGPISSTPWTPRDSSRDIVLPSAQSAKVLPAPAPRESPFDAAAIAAYEARERPKPGAFRYLAGLLFLGGSLAGAGFSWVRYLGPQVMTPTVDAPAPVVTASATASATSSKSELLESKWNKPLTEGQKLFGAGDLKGAQRKFKEALDLGGGGTARGLAEQAKAAGEGTGACKVIALSHPRSGPGLAAAAGRPTIVATKTGAIVAWTDGHEVGHERVYSTAIDAAGVASAPLELTPEGDQVMRPVLLPADDRVALFYWDKSGVYARLLDAEGHIDQHVGDSVLIAGGKAAGWPSYLDTPTGFSVVWEDKRDGNDDLFFRRLKKDLTADGVEVRLTDYAPGKSHTASVNVPAMAMAANSMLIAYRLDRDKSQAIYRMRLSLAAPELAKGLDEKTEAGRSDRELGETKVLHDTRGDAPSLACGTQGCFIAWNEEPKGAWIAMVDPTQGKPYVWKKHFAPNGSRPALAVGPKGDVVIAYYEAGKVKIAPVSRDGVGTSSIFAKLAGDPPRPFIAPGKEVGDWYIGWLDVEATRTEVYIARLTCPR